MGVYTYIYIYIYIDREREREREIEGEGETEIHIVIGPLLTKKYFISIYIYICMYVIFALSDSKRPTALSIPRRSPIQVLTQPYVA